MNRPTLLLAGLASALTLPLSAQTVTTTLLHDTFADGERATQSLPDSARWLTSASNSTANIDIIDGSLVTKNGFTTLAYFTAAGSPVTLAVGESLTLTFTVSLSGITDAVGNFRVGLYSSGTRLAADNFGNSNAAFTGSYAGYMATVNVGASSNNAFRLYERGSSTSLIAGSVSNYSQTGSSSGGAYKTFVPNNTYTGTIVLSRTAESTMSVSHSYTGIFGADSTASTTSATIFDNSGLTTSFDTLAFYYNNTANLVFDNVRIDYAAIPEPSSAAALAGGLVLGAAALRRRRRA